MGLGRKVASAVVGAVVLWLAPNAVAADQLLETLNVDPANTALTTGTAQLKQGTEYQLQISGTFTLANGFGQSVEEDALYCFGDSGFAEPQCTPTPQRYGDFYIGSSAGKLKNIDAFQEPTGGGPQIGYGITHRYNVNFYPPANGPLIAGGTLAESQCKSGPNPCTTTISGGPITIQIYGPAPTPPPPPPPPPPTKTSPIAIAKPAIAWNVPTSLLMLAAGKTGVETSPPLAKGQTSASVEVTGSNVDKVKPVLTSTAARTLICVAFAIREAAKRTKQDVIYYSDPQQKTVSRVVKRYENLDPNQVAADIVVNIIACLVNFDRLADTLVSSPDVASGASACPVSSQRFKIGELDMKKTRLQPIGAGLPSNLSVACARSSSGLIVALKSHGTDLRSIFGPHLLLGLYNDHTATATASTQVTFSNGAAPPPPPPTPPTFTGTWNTSFGAMQLTQTGSSVSGTYALCNGAATISGTVTGSTLNGTWTEPCDGGQGQIQYVLSADGKSFAGLWGVGTATPTQPWNGTRVS